MELGVHVSWHEAVAITLKAAAADASGEGASKHTPLDISTCMLSRGGDVEFCEPSTPIASTSLNGFFLQLLTDPDAPPELLRRARTVSPENLVDDLEVVASTPKRRRMEVAAVAIRALTIEAELSRRTVDALRGLPLEPELPPVVNAAGKVVPAEEQDAEFNRLRAQVSDVEIRGRRWSFRRTVDLRLVGAVGVPAALGLAWWLWSPGSPPLPAPPRLFDVPRGIRAVNLDPHWMSLGPEPSIVPTASETTRTGAVPTAVEGGAPPPAETTERVAEDTPSSTAPEPASPAPSAPVEPPASPPSSPEQSPRPAPADPPDSTVYSAANTAVQPPVLRYPNLPNAVVTGNGIPIVGPYFEVLVDQAGRVETVRLRGRPDRSETYYRHRMMLAAAKAWQFAPARLEGRPVRYTALVLLTP